ncbi:hypothetical protein REPUB_Repub16aG0127600 [Reevesia pubescens]
MIKDSSASPTTTLPIPEALDKKFGRKGIKFLESNNVPFVELTVRNGSSLRLKIPDAHLTSYKPKVYWKDDGFEDILYIVPAGGADSTKGKGGIGLVELSCTAGTLGISYVVSLYPLSIATAVIVNYNGRKDVSSTSTILSHLNFKKRGSTAINGLQGCSYCSHQPLSSPFELLSPSEAMKSESSGWFGSESEEKPGVWTKQDVPITILKNKLRRVYAAPPSERLKAIYNTPPSKYETLDHLSYHTYLPSASLQYINNMREFPLPPVASIPYQPINVDYLEGEFNRHGFTFEGNDDSCVAKRRLDNGSTTTVMRPSGLITSYKAPMWPEA